MVNKFLYPAGGAETYMFKLGKHLEALGNEIQYFGMDSESRCVSNMLDCYTDKIDFRNAGTTKKIKYSVKSVYSAEAKQKIARVLDAFKPDIVHLNNINFQLTPAIIPEIKKRGIPIVQTVHDVQIACPNHRMYNEETQKICSECKINRYLPCIKNKCVHGSALKSALAAFESYLYHKKGTYNLVDRYICPSDFMKEAIASGGISEDRITVLHNFSDIQAETKRDSSCEKYILYFGRLSIEKGIKTLIEAVKELPEITLILAGTGPLEKIADGIENIKAIGFKSGDELKGLIRNAMFAVCPSEWYENCPMSVVEALSLGTPVICSDLGGSKELIENGKTGIVFEAGSKDALKEAILTLYNNPEELEKMRPLCLEASSNNIERYSERLLNIYRELNREKENG